MSNETLMTPRPERGDDRESGDQESRPSGKRSVLAPIALLVAVAALGGGLVWWKGHKAAQAAAASADMPEYSEVITVASARELPYRKTTTSIGTVVALRSVALRNEVAGTVASANLVPGQIVEAGAVLLALDVSVEEAELKAQQAHAALARNLAQRMERAMQGRAATEIDLDRARSELDAANAQSARLEAVIARKTLRAPFRARVGLSDVHPGQYLSEGTLIANLEGVDQSTQIDFAVPQLVAQGLRVGETIQAHAALGTPPIQATIVALDSRADRATRNITVRARVEAGEALPPPGSSVRVEVPSGAALAAVAVPINAVRKGPEGDHVFTIGADDQGQPRAHAQRVGIGPVLGDEILILSGLKAGDQVAAFGSFKLREGGLVQIVANPEAQAGR